VASGGDENFDPVAITAIGRCQKAISAATVFFAIATKTLPSRRANYQK
jgi:hypothetical protein